MQMFFRPLTKKDVIAALKFLKIGDDRSILGVWIRRDDRAKYAFTTRCHGVTQLHNTLREAVQYVLYWAA
jgi:hypothetical protein